MGNFTIHLSQDDLNDKEKMDELQKLMDAYHEEMNKHIEAEAKRLGVSEWCANDVVYLRSRSRWTQEKEDELIRLHKNGTPPNVFEF